MTSRYGYFSVCLSPTDVYFDQEIAIDCHNLKYFFCAICQYSNFGTKYLTISNIVSIRDCTNIKSTLYPSHQFIEPYDKLKHIIICRLCNVDTGQRYLYSATGGFIIVTTS